MAFHFHTHEDSIFADTIAITLSEIRKYNVSANNAKCNNAIWHY